MRQFAEDRRGKGWEVGSRKRVLSTACSALTSTKSSYTERKWKKKRHLESELEGKDREIERERVR